MARSKLKGVARVRRILRALEPAMRAELVEELRRGGQQLAARMEVLAPVLAKPDKRRVAGAFAAKISFSVSEKLLRLRVGLLGKATNRNLFYVRWLEFGRKASVVTAHRSSAAQKSSFAAALLANGALGGKKRKFLRSARSTYLLHVGALAPRPAIFAKATDIRGVFRQRLKFLWQRVLQRASGAGGSDD